MLPDRSLIKEQKMVENVKIEKCKFWFEMAEYEFSGFKIAKNCLKTPKMKITTCRGIFKHCDDDAFVNFSLADFVSLVLLFRTEFVWREMSYAL